MTSTIEAVPTVWTAGDEDFFRVAADLFAPNFLYGAGVLLGSYDPEPAPSPSASTLSTDPARRAPAGSWPLAA
jgi:hypothetical protein